MLKLQINRTTNYLKGILSIVCYLYKTKIVYPTSLQKNIFVDRQLMTDMKKGYTVLLLLLYVVS